MSPSAECPGCGLPIAEHDDAVTVGEHRFHSTCAEDHDPPIDPDEQRGRRRRFSMLIASKIGIGRNITGPAPLPPRP